MKSASYLFTVTMTPRQYQTWPLTLGLHLATDEVREMVQTHAIGHGLGRRVGLPDQGRGKADGEAIGTRLVRIRLQPALGRHHELHHVGSPLCTPRVDDL